MDQDPDTTIAHDLFPIARLYKSGRLERLFGTEVIPAGTDSTTGVISKDVPVNSTIGVSARLYLPPNIPSNTKFPILVYFHGGGFVIESPKSRTYHSLLNSIVSKANVVAISVEYRRAPEHPLPVAYDDCWDVLAWATSRSSPDDWISEYGDLERLYLGGDSAGANAAHNMAVKAASEGIKIKGLILCHPWFSGSEPIGIEDARPEDLKKSSLLWMFVYPSMISLDDPLINPMASEERLEKVFKCDKVFVTVAEKDILRDRGRLYYEKLVEAIANGKWSDGKAKFYEAEGEDHVFYLQNPLCDKGVEMMDIITKFID
ncbi:hypothetical protein LUZ60_017526 [Juncus effusus]|nr:hypothetical protein LUZ60_017526 [Juncus effusus]